MTVKVIRPKREVRLPARLTRQNAEKFLAEIENSSDSPLIARELLALRREREGKEPADKTIDQVFVELERE